MLWAWSIHMDDCRIPCPYMVVHTWPVINVALCREAVAKHNTAANSTDRCSIVPSAFRLGKSEGLGCACNSLTQFLPRGERRLRWDMEGDYMGSSCRTSRHNGQSSMLVRTMTLPPATFVSIRLVPSPHSTCLASDTGSADPSDMKSMQRRYSPMDLNKRLLFSIQDLHISCVAAKRRTKQDCRLATVHQPCSTSPASWLFC